VQTINGIAQTRAGNASLEELVMALHVGAAIHPFPAGPAPRATATSTTIKMNRDTSVITGKFSFMFDTQYNCIIRTQIYSPTAIVIFVGAMAIQSGPHQMVNLVHSATSWVKVGGKTEGYPYNLKRAPCTCLPDN